MIGAPDMAKLNLVKIFNSLNKTSNCLNNDSNNLSSYFAGLFEGDGHIWIPSSNLTKKHNPRFHITFHLKDLPLANKLLEIIEFGFIRFKPKENACVLTVSSVKGLKFIINLINGNLRTPKINQVNLLIDWLNKHHNSNIPILSLSSKTLFEDAWLAGFIDADGSFGLRHTKPTTTRSKRRISCRFRLEQRMLDPITGESYKTVLSLIANNLHSNLTLRKQSGTDNIYYLIDLSSIKSITLLRNYLDNSSLFTSKYLDYQDWRKACNLILNNLHYTNEGINQIDNLKSNMNRKRTYFNWDHLENLKFK